MFGTLTCHRDDTGASGRRVSFKLTGLSSSRVEHEQMEDRLHGCGGPQLLAKGHGAVEAFPSHGTQRLAPGRAKSQVPRVRTALVDVPAASCECWDHGVNTSGHLPQRATNPQNWRATDPNTSRHQPRDWAGRRCFLTLSVSSSSSKSGPSWCSRSQAGLPQAHTRCVGGRINLLTQLRVFLVDACWTLRWCWSPGPCGAFSSWSLLSCLFWQVSPLDIRGCRLVPWWRIRGVGFHLRFLLLPAPVCSYPLSVTWTEL